MRRCPARRYNRIEVETVNYTVVIEKGRESGYVASVPVLRGCVSQGETRDEALRNVREAIEAYVDALLEDDLPLPTEEGKEFVELQVRRR